MIWIQGPSVLDRQGDNPSEATRPLRFNDREYGGSGRRQFCVADWDGDGILDLLVQNDPNVILLRGLGRNAEGCWVFREDGPVSADVLIGHSPKPTTLDLNGDGLPDLLIGAEDGYLYQLLNLRTGS